MSFKRRAAAMFALLVVLLQVPRPTVAWAADVSSGVGSGADLGSGAGSGTGAGSGLGAGADLGGSVTGAYRRDENYVSLKPDDISIWDNGDYICISGGKAIAKVASPRYRYLVALSKYLDSDGKYTVQADIWVSDVLNDTRPSLECFFRKESDTFSEADSSIQFWVYISGAPSYYCYRMRDGLYQGNDGAWHESAVRYVSSSSSRQSYLRRERGLYTRPYYEGKYVIYCSSTVDPSICVKDPAFAAFDVNPLPGVCGDAGSGMPYATTFRLLTGDGLVYNTFYYTSSYLSGPDTVSASGNIRFISTRLSDGVKQFQLLEAPQVLCQKSTYGTAYDIVSTNDNNLLSLLGIQKPVERYWDVAAQEWKVSIGSGIGPGTEVGGGGTPAPTPNPTPSPGTGTGFQLDYGLSPLANFSRWLQAKGYPVASNVAYLFAIESVADFGSLVAEYLGLYTYNEATQRFGAASDGVSDLWKKVSEASIASAVTKEFTDRFSYDKVSGHHVWSPDAVAPVSVPGLGLAIASGTGAGGTSPSGTPAPTPGGTGGGTGGNITIGGPGWEGIGEFNDYVQTGIAEGVSSAGSFLSGVLSTAKGLLLDMGVVPALLAELFSFLPAGITTIIGVGLGLWLLPALLGLARGGLKAAGGMFSSLFRFIASFFS